MNARLQPQKMLDVERCCEVEIPPEPLQSLCVFSVKVTVQLKRIYWDGWAEIAVVRANFAARSQLACSILKRSLYALFFLRASSLFFAIRCLSVGVSWFGFEEHPSFPFLSAIELPQSLWRLVDWRTCSKTAIRFSTLSIRKAEKRNNGAEGAGGEQEVASRSSSFNEEARWDVDGSVRSEVGKEISTGGAGDQHGKDVSENNAENGNEWKWISSWKFRLEEGKGGVKKWYSLLGHVFVFFLHFWKDRNDSAKLLEIRL